MTSLKEGIEEIDEVLLLREDAGVGADGLAGPRRLEGGCLSSVYNE